MTLAAVPDAAIPSRAEAAAVAARLVAGVEQVVHGRRTQVELVVCAVLAGGHVLPGLRDDLDDRAGHRCEQRAARDRVGGVGELDPHAGEVQRCFSHRLTLCRRRFRRAGDAHVVGTSSTTCSGRTACVCRVLPSAPTPA